MCVSVCVCIYIMTQVFNLILVRKVCVHVVNVFDRGMIRYVTELFKFINHNMSDVKTNVTFL